MKDHAFLKLILIALILKLLLFCFAEMKAPQAKFMPDTWRYIETSESLMRQGIFATKDQTGHYHSESYRTPGYPLFLGIAHYLLRMPFSFIILVQIFGTFIAAFFVYRTMHLIDHRLAPLSTLIILFDPPITIFSLLLLSETLFLILISLFMFFFVSYLKEKRVRWLIASSIFLAIATYVRPISYYLGIFVAVFIFLTLIRKNLKEGIAHALFFALIAYTILGFWPYRNYKLFHKPVFTIIEQSNLRAFGLAHSFARNDDPVTQGMRPVPYYINVSARTLASLMTRPGSFKYFQSPLLKAIGKILAYPWMAFWLIGFLVGLSKLRTNCFIQFSALVVFYFIATSIGGVLWLVSSRFRIPMMPFIAIIAACGWHAIYAKIRQIKK